MPYLSSSQGWLKQSSLLLQARPSSARITTKYTIAHSPAAETTSPPPQSQSAISIPAPVRGSLTVKTYDPVSGVCLKYRTNKAAEVGRLIASLGRLAKAMTGQISQDESSLLDATMTEAPPVEHETGTSTPVPEMIPAKEPKGNDGGDIKGVVGKKKKKGRK